MRRNRKIGIQTLLLRVFLLVVALAALLGAIFVYNRINATILRQFDDRLIATSALTGALIDPAARLQSSSLPNSASASS